MVHGARVVVHELEVVPEGGGGGQRPGLNTGANAYVRHRLGLYLVEVGEAELDRFSHLSQRRLGVQAAPGDRLAIESGHQLHRTQDVLPDHGIAQARVDRPQLRGHRRHQGSGVRSARNVCVVEARVVGVIGEHVVARGHEVDGRRPVVRVGRQVVLVVGGTNRDHIGISGGIAGRQHPGVVVVGTPVARRRHDQDPGALGIGNQAGQSGVRTDLLAKGHIDDLHMLGYGVFAGRINATVAERVVVPAFECEDLGLGCGSGPAPPVAGRRGQDTVNGGGVVKTRSGTVRLHVA